MARRDPYMNDPNIRSAANVMQVAWMALGVGVGAALSGWFDFPAYIGVVGGLVLGMLIGSLMLRQYGGRSTR